MPTYDYRCRDCGHTIEIIHSILEDGPEVCERCRGPMERVLHPAGVIFRGSGFYVTDSRSSKTAPGEDSSGSSGERGGTAKTGSSEGSGESPAKGPAGTSGKD
ncbi:MAG: FmdB family zinc ribbon protein [Candidatus Limnocylindria bacterium]